MIRKIRNSEDGVVGIIVAVLLIGLMVSVISLVQLVYVPDWMEQRESAHMDRVAAQFSQLKFAIDTQYSNKQKYTPIATSITLGSKELSYWMSVRAFGRLQIVPNAITIEISNGTDPPESFSLGTIKYSSSNAYFLNQDFIYENGAIITSQDDGNIISTKPSFYTENDGYNIFFRIVNISGIGGKNSSSGYGTTAIQTEFGMNTTPSTIYNVESITITTSYLNAWKIFLSWTLTKVYGDDFEIEDTDTNKLTVRFNNHPDVELTYVQIYAQIGPGWIE